MPKRKGPEEITEDKTRQIMLRGITDETAVALYDEGMRILRERDQADFLAASQMRDAAQWSIVINQLQAAIVGVIKTGDADDAKLRRLMRSKREAEDARRRVLDGLMLAPRGKPGRPKSQETEAEDKPEEDAAQSAWDAFESDDNLGERDEDQ